jgi:cytochrome c oxidase subunit I
MVAGLMAMLMRAELARPGLQFLSNEQYNQLFTQHGTIMLSLYATPTVFAFANLVLPLQIGAPDVAFPPVKRFFLLIVPVRRVDRALRIPYAR